MLLAAVIAAAAIRSEGRLLAACHPPGGTITRAESI
jgi:hypothetical protein